MKNGNKWKVIAIVLMVISMVIGVVYGYGRLNGRFEAVETEVKKVNENENAIIGIQKDIDHLNESMDRIEIKFDKFYEHFYDK